MSALTLTITILLSFLIVIFLIYFLLKPNERTIIHGPTVLTSLGIFGTFLGVAIGLLGFDPDNILESIPHFLDGMKLAFWSSVFGIAAAIIHKIRFIIFNEEPESISETDVENNIEQIAKSIQAIEKYTVEILDKPLDISVIEKGLAQVITSNRAALANELSNMQDGFDSLKDRESTMINAINSQFEMSVKSMLNFLKETLETTRESSANITLELAKIREDISTDVRATSELSETLIQQLRTMNEAYKAALLATATEIKSQISTDMETLTNTTRHSQAEGMEKLTGIAEIMQNVVVTSSKLADTLHENTVSMQSIQQAFTGTNEGTVGRVMQTMSADTIKQLIKIDDALGTQGDLAQLLQESNTRHNAQFIELEQRLSDMIDELRKLPREITRQSNNDQL